MDTVITVWVLIPILGAPMRLVLSEQQTAGIAARVVLVVAGLANLNAVAVVCSDLAARDTLAALLALKGLGLQAAPANPVAAVVSQVRLPVPPAAEGTHIAFFSLAGQDISLLSPLNCNLKTGQSILRRPTRTQKATSAEVAFSLSFMYPRLSPETNAVPAPVETQSRRP